MGDGSALADAQWVQALDALERDLEQAEDLIARRESASKVEVGAWAAPELSTSLPIALAERAAGLAARQEALIEQLPAAIVAVRRQSAVTTKMSWSSHSPGQASVYVDTTA